MQGLISSDTAEMLSRQHPAERRRTPRRHRGGHREWFLHSRGGAAMLCWPPNIRGRHSLVRAARYQRLPPIPQANWKARSSGCRLIIFDLYQFHWPNRGKLYVSRKKTGPYDPNGTEPRADASRKYGRLSGGPLQVEVDPWPASRASGCSKRERMGLTQWANAVRLRTAGRSIATVQNEIFADVPSGRTDVAEVLPTRGDRMLSSRRWRPDC